MSTNPNPNPSPSPDPNPAPQPKKRKTKPNAFADVMHQWESLLNAVADHATELARVEPHRAALADSLEKVKQAKALQDAHTANRQSTTQTMKEILAEGKDRAIRLRGAVRAEIGPTSEQLVQFGIRPLRGRASRSKPSGAPTPTPAPPPETPAPVAKAAKGAE